MRYLLLILLMVGCSDPLAPDSSFYELTLDSRLEIDGNGYGQFVYSGHEYFMIDFDINSNIDLESVRVYWTSPNTYDEIVQGIVIGKLPIIDNSSHSGEYGRGSQSVYVSNDMIGDTLIIYGHILDYDIDSLKIIVE